MTVVVSTPADPSTESSSSEPSHPFRYNGALAQQIELRWQDWWAQHGTFETPNPAGSLAEPVRAAGRRKLFVLDMFPYPSGAGLHVGHPLGYIGTDVYSRFKRMTGHNVLYAMGFDAFGLPAEQYAVQTGTHPATTTEQNVETMRRQLRRLGLSHDPRRSISTTDPAYYRWTQWIFLQIFNSWYDAGIKKARPIADLVTEFSAGTRATPDGRPWSTLSASERHAVVAGYRLAYISESPVNWCPGLGTVVANEEVTADGRSDRGNFPVFKRRMRQWTMRITAYADRLVDDLDLLDWSESIKAMQRNWIGRSEGAHVDFASPAGPIRVFTTRPDTLFGASFLVLAPEHPLVDALTTPDRAAAVAGYRRQAAAKSDVARQVEEKTKTGVFTGAHAVNPTTGQPVPIWIADYVLMGYGTGAIMAVPCGDTRDFAFARQFGLPIPAIQQPPATWFQAHGVAVQEASALDTSTWPEAFVGDAPYVNSANATLDLNGLSSIAEAVHRTCAWLEARHHGTAVVTYKLRDWLFSRQRYWGEPFPIVYDEDGHAHALPESLLPLELPPTDSFSPRTFDPDDAMSNPESPLDRLDWWTSVELDLGDGPKRYRRDTNVMPQWAGSCWYELRYCDPANDRALVDPDVERYWMGPQDDTHPGGVDLYVGGVEHAVLHLLYARFWHKVLFDLGYVSSKEPYYRLFNQGYVLAAAYKDERGIYVDATAVEGDEGAFTHEGRPVTREWGKMGKSLKNAVAPDAIYEAYGADTLRLYEMAMGPLDASRPWETRDVVGMFRFLQRTWRNLVDEDSGQIRGELPAMDEATDRLLHKTIDGVTSDMGGMRFNTAIAKLIEWNNHLTRVGGCPSEAADRFVLLLAPLAPHLAEELWRLLGHTSSLAYEAFPVADPAKLVDDTIELPVQVNGKVRSHITVSADADKAAVQAVALADPKVQASLGGATPKKVVVVPGRMVSLVI
jgi:leucyl-tRNA synthetase